ncbi:MAG: ATP-dependent sacrificial sulfur transferase LarE [Gemmatales bacterium]|nr:ATP-dependent sacrificial sulfur transferase LarE [Gemmatales bacterium]MDW8387978.1 ATP-dependent sacrificial sulfur transferase LarE [Gemmatales bacterium]
MESVSDTTLTPDLLAQRDKLLALLRSLESVVVAFSGGVDSAVVAKAARLALGENAVAVTGDSPSLPRSELEAARRLAEVIGIRHLILPTQELEEPNYVRNGGDRCYFCKTELYDRIAALLPALGAKWICSGANRDDLGDYRPGLQAAAERNVRHPLQEVGLSKSEVRLLARYWHLPVWDKPASPCLSSRIAPGLPVTTDRLNRIERAEAFLKANGFRDCRVRLHEGELARIEVPSEQIAEILDAGFRNRLLDHLTGLGFRFVTMDLAGLRSGSLNALVDLEVRRRFETKVR